MNDKMKQQNPAFVQPLDEEQQKIIDALMACPIVGEEAKNANAVPQDQDAKDAARYRFMRGNESIKFWSRLGELKPIEWDDFIDAARGEMP